jgi:multiple antibiotic resistance protein
MIETALTAFATFFATIGPIEAAVLFAALTTHYSRSERRVIAYRATGIATAILLFFALFGLTILRYLGVSFPALQAAGGIILLLIALDMTFARGSGPLSMTQAETVEAGRKEEITVFPLATPLLAGPGAISAVTLMIAKTGGVFWREALVIMALLGVMGVAAAMLLVAQEVHAFLGVTAQKVIMRVFGILLAGIAVQALFDGVKGSGIFAKVIS